MGLTNRSVGMGAVDEGLVIQKRNQTDRVVALAGNPNVGKSTVFNGLTGMNQHTGNWPGKTVANAQGYCASPHHGYVLVDIPGTYSLMAHSAEEEVARNFICFDAPDAVVVVCDATCLERNLNLVLQTIEISKRVIVCVNLMDEAKRKQISIDLPKLEKRLGVRVISTVARSKKSLAGLLQALDTMAENAAPSTFSKPLQVVYPDVVERAIALVEPVIDTLQARLAHDDWDGQKGMCSLNSRWLSLRLLEQDSLLKQEMHRRYGTDFLESPALVAACDKAWNQLEREGVTKDTFTDLVVSSLVKTAEQLCDGVVVYQKTQYSAADRRMDQILTSKLTGYPVMLLLLALIFWLTITGANAPSQLLANGLFWLQERLRELLVAIGSPGWLIGLLIDGMYRVLSFVVSVMLPPMAIFFPLFTLLEDAGYLPRVAYNLDAPFARCHACGKQALTMWLVVICMPTKRGIPMVCATFKNNG